MAKRLPITRTLTFDLTTHLIDTYTKTRSLKVAQSLAVRENDEYTALDLVLTDTPKVIGPVKKGIIISSYGPFLIDLKQNGVTTVGVKCTSLFLLLGSFESVSLYLPPPVNAIDPIVPLRASCQYV